MTYLLDTDTFTLSHRGTHGVRARVTAARAAGDTVAVPLITLIEVLQGRFASILKAADGPAMTLAVDWLRKSEEYLSEFRVLPFDAVVIRVFDRLRADRSAKKAGRNDLLIACAALAHDATLVTRNTKDFALTPGVKLVNWAD